MSESTDPTLLLATTLARWGAAFHHDIQAVIDFLLPGQYSVITIGAGASCSITVRLVTPYEDFGVIVMIACAFLFRRFLGFGQIELPLVAD